MLSTFADFLEQSCAHAFEDKASTRDEDVFRSLLVPSVQVNDLKNIFIGRKRAFHEEKRLP